MSYRRALLTGTGWAGTLGAVAVCVLVFLSAFLAFESRDGDIGPRPDDAVWLPEIPDERLPTVPLAEPPGSSGGVGGAGGGGAGGRGSGGGAAPGGRGEVKGSGPEARSPQPGAGRPGPGGGGTPQPGGGGGTPPASGGGGGGSQPPPSGGGRNTLGETTRRVARDAGAAAGHISPAGGQLVSATGESAADAIERLPAVPLPDLPQDVKLPVRGRP
jgi:hypothetical protein